MPRGVRELPPDFVGGNAGQRRRWKHTLEDVTHALRGHRGNYAFAVRKAHHSARNINAVWAAWQDAPEWLRLPDALQSLRQWFDVLQQPPQPPAVPQGPPPPLPAAADPPAAVLAAAQQAEAAAEQAEAEWAERVAAAVVAAPQDPPPPQPQVLLGGEAPAAWRSRKRTVLQDDDSSDEDEVEGDFQRRHRNNVKKLCTIARDMARDEAAHETQRASAREAALQRRCAQLEAQKAAANEEKELALTAADDYRLANARNVKALWPLCCSVCNATNFDEPRPPDGEHVVAACDDNHGICQECLDGMCYARKNGNSEDSLKCCVPGCTAPHFSNAALGKATKDAFAALVSARTRDEAREAEQEAREAAARNGASLEAAIAASQVKRPCCGRPIDGFSDCCSIHCNQCNKYFCAMCFEVGEGTQNMHGHLYDRCPHRHVRNDDDPRGPDQPGDLYAKEGKRLDKLNQIWRDKKFEQIMESLGIPSSVGPQD